MPLYFLYTQPVFLLESKMKMYIHIVTYNFGANGDDADNFGRFGPILRL